MPTRSLSLADAKAAVALVEKCLDEGYTLTRHNSAVQEAARRAIQAGMVKASGTFYSRLRIAKEQHRVTPLASEVRGVTPAVLPSDSQSKAERKVSSEPVDPLERQRARDSSRREATDTRKLLRELADAQDIRKSILGLLEEPLEPRLAFPLDNEIPGGSGERAIVLMLSDVHYGETVDSREMDGVNSYSESIAQARLGRFFQKVTALSTRHWTGKPPKELVLCLGGDLISGDIHAELRETNAPAVPATVKGAAQAIAAGIIHMREQIGCPIRVYSVPGNHGRLTLKPQSKHRAALSLDLLCADFIELMVKNAGYPDVTFYQTHSPDAYFSTFRWNWLLNHGDTMGSKGGQGFIGAAATIVRGHRKLMDTSLRSGRMIHFLLTGHLHTTVRTTFGWAGGSVVGYGEYARDGRMDPEPAKQWMLVIHDREGVIDEKEIYLGVPAEGSHYLGPASFIRPALNQE